MAFTFDSTIQGASANSYVAVSSANDYLTGRLDVTEWTAAATATQQIALAMATARLETESYVGSPSTDTQRLQWPRYSVPHQHWGTSTWYGYGPPVYDSSVIPQPVIEACCELALVYLKDNTALDDTGLEGFEQVTIGPISVTPRHERKAASLPVHVQRLLRGIRVASGGSIPVIRG